MFFKRRNPIKTVGRKKKRPRRLLRLGIVFIVLLALFITAYEVLGVSKWKDLDTERITDIKQTLIIYDDQGQEALRLTGGENRIKISIADLPDYVKNAFISAEDVRFYQHNGLDYKRIVGAVLADIKHMGYTQGASTITQQLIKNSHLTSEKTISRKLQEALLAYQLEKKYTKDEILEMYLNFVYFGRGAYGLQTAAQTYFAVDAKDLTVAQAAMLAGVLKAPGKYAPHLNMEKAITRRNTVLNLMEEYGFITSEECETYKKEEVVLAPAPDRTYSYGFYTDMVLEEAADMLDITVEDLLGGGYHVYTTMDQTLQEQCEEIYENAALFPADAADGTQVQSAAVVLDNRTGAIKAIIGGREHTTMRALNRATMMQRQPGSTIKPVLVFAPAFEDGLLTPASVLDDQHKSFGDYSPSNFGEKYYGKVTVREALVHSLNVPAVEGLELLGIENGKSFAEKLGITFTQQDQYLALALGGFTKGCTPLQIANAYQAFGNGGRYTQHTCISAITDADGNTLYENKPVSSQVMSAETAFQISDILAEATKSSVNNKLSTLSYPVCSKTGTVGYGETDGYSDAWIAAYDSQYTVSVWMGYDRTDSTHYLSEGVTGSTYPSHVAKEIFNCLHGSDAPAAIEKPAGIVEVNIDKLTLLNDNKIVLATNLTPQEYIFTEYFTQKTMPVFRSDYWQRPQPPDDLSWELNELRQPVLSFTAAQSYISYRLYRVSDGKRECIFSVNGQENKKIFYTDTTAESGKTYEYYILPEHMNIFEEDHLLQGYASSSVFAEAP